MKKLFFKSIVLALVAAVAVSAVAASGCSSKCEHDVSEWTVVKEATCSTEGLREGICGICYETVQEVIPIDENAHVYGEWSVTAPTTTKTGSAVKTCTLNPDHYTVVTLPTLDDKEGVYTSQITTMPTANSNGVSTYTYKHELGDITFDVTLDSSGVQTVSDAVGVGSNSASHANIRSATGKRGTGKSSIQSDEAVAMSYNSFEYQLYSETGYTHVVADDSKVYYMGLDGDEIYGYVKDDVSGEVTTTSDKNLYYGYKYYIARTETLGNYYGTENFLAGLYSFGKANYNGDFTQSVDNGVYSFSFGTYTIYASGKNGARFSIVSVTFTLTENFTIATLTCDVDTYENDSSTYDASTGTWNSGALFDFDENGYAYAKDKDYDHYDEYIEVTQYEKTSADTIQSNEYSADSRFYSNFDITYNGTVLSDGATVSESMVAGTSTGYVFGITNLTPSDVIGDDVKFYYRDNGTDTLINYGTESSVGILVSSLNSSNRFYIKSYISGTLTFVAKTQNVERTFKITFVAAAPSAFYSTYYEYTSSNVYTENTSSTSSASVTIYAGQPLYYKASLSASESGKCTETFKTAVTGANSESDYDIADAVALALDPMNSDSEQVSVSSFTAYVAGTYTLTLTSTEDDSITCTITVTVEAMPDVSKILTGTYTGTFNLDGQTGASVTVTFGSDSTSTVSDGTVSLAKHDLTVTINYVYNGTGTELTLICTYYTDSTGDTIYTSSYTAAKSGAEILSSAMEHEDEEGYEDYYEADEMFRLTLSDNYSLVISHNMATDTDEQEQIILTKSS
ncbi:MAG: hypothetical protein LUI60_03180 [Clostridia bacterium]|nr:hypothetical protein [Clostridia bacterium]